MDIKELITSFFKRAEAQKIRSSIIPIQDKLTFTYQADINKPYSFEIVNTSSVDMQSKGVTIVKGGNVNSMPTKLAYPRVGVFKRSDVVVLTGEGGGQMNGFIREDLELTG